MLRSLVWVGLGAIAVFTALRAGGLGDYHQPGPGLIGFLNLTKYPPSLDFLLVTLGVDLVLVSVGFRVRVRAIAGPLGALSWAFPRGTSWAVMYAVWAATVAAMYPACRWYAGFKASTPVSAFWRLL